MAITRRDLIRFGAGFGALAVTGACGQGAVEQDAEARRRRPRASTTSTTARGSTTVAAGPPTTAGHDDHATATDTSATETCCTTPVGGRWSDPATWGTRAVPKDGEKVQVSGPVILDVDAKVAGLTIAEGATLIFDPATSHTLSSSANIVVQGKLALKPARADVRHMIAFTGVREADFAGEGMAVLESDVGLWVTGNGALDLAGSPKLAWSRAASSLAAGATSVSLEAVPNGWQSGDEIVITPTELPAPEQDDGTNFHASHRSEVVTITGIAGSTVQFTPALKVSHPRVELGPAGALGAEVLNLSRNVRIEGTPKGRAHVMILHASTAQSIKYTGLRYLAPEKNGEGVKGRYALHFHHCKDGSIGSVLEGLVARDTGGHAFVPHESNGTTWRDCIAFEVIDHAYWWDDEENSAGTLLERCVACNVWSHRSVSYTMGGFQLGRGPAGSNVVRGCVATNISGNGFLWYDGSDGDWDTTDCVAHNVGGSGIWVWSNHNETNQIIRNFTAYRNDEYGIDHGAYANSYQYAGGSLVGNHSGPIGVHAVSNSNERNRSLSFSDLYIDASGRDYGILLPDGSPVPPDGPTVVANCTFVNASKAGILVAAGGNDAWIQVKGCTFSGNELFVENGIGSRSRIEFANSRFGHVMVGKGSGGQSVAEWNAVVTPV